MRKHIFFILAFLLLAAVSSAQEDRREVRSGNRKFNKGKMEEAEIDYRKAVFKDSLSLAARYNLSSVLYGRGDYENAAKEMGAVAQVSLDASEKDRADYSYNNGNISSQLKDWEAAVKHYREALLLNPDDMDAKENYTYAKMMLKKGDKGGGGGQNRQNQQDEKNQDDRQDKQDKQDENQPQQQPQQQQNDDKGEDKAGNEPSGQQMSSSQAQQILRAVQAKEKDTQEKVNREKAQVMKSRQKEKNW